jgi:hypothetical protein
MAHRRNKDNRSKSPEPVPPAPVHQISSAAQTVADRIARSGVDYLRENLIPVMIDSGKFAKEPEFIDLTMDPHKTPEVTGRWLQKYDKLLKAAQKKGKSEFQQVYDEVRIKTIAELATPAFRKDVDQRLQALIERLMTGNNLKDLEMAFILEPLLKLKDVPWGICMLIIEIYNRTMEQSMQKYEEQKEVMDAIGATLKAEGEEMIDVDKVLQSPAKLERFGQKLFAKNPGIRERLEKQAMDIVDAFESELAKGNVDLDLFSEAELVLPFQRIAQEIGKPVAELQSDDIQNRFFEAMRQTIAEIMTPDRLRQTRQKLESTAKIWLRERQKWAGTLEIELGWMEDEKYEDNKFILSAFIGQSRQAGKGQKLTHKVKKR